MLVRTRWRLNVAGLALLLLAAASGAAAQDGSIRIFDSLFNQFAAQLEPLKMNGHYKYVVPSFLGPVTICESDWTAQVSGLKFTTTSVGTKVTGNVHAHWCFVDFDGALSTNAHVSYSNGSLWVTVDPTAIQPALDLPGGYHVLLPVTIDVASALSLPPIPVNTVAVSFLTESGSDTLRLTPLHVSLSRGNGYIQIQSDVAVW